MDKQLIWMIKSAYRTPTRKILGELASEKNLFDESDIDKSDKEYDEAVRNYYNAKESGVELVTYIDEEYPEALKTISMPPRVLFVRGDKKALMHGMYVGIVGSRRTDDYGLRMASSLAFELGQTGVGIISGGALGIDAAAHMGALRSNAKTIAVLGCGIDVTYPKANAPLFERIADEGGAVVTVFMYGEIPRRENFPHRNRIIASLSASVIVVRASHRSGALITANQAINMGKSVFAIPGNIDNSLSAGTNALIRDGAGVLLSSMDIIDELMLENPDFFAKCSESDGEEKETACEEMINLKGLSAPEEEVIRLIKEGKSSAEEMEQFVSFAPARITAVLGMLELKGIIRRGFDKKYKFTSGG